MDNDKQRIAGRQIKSITYLGMVVNVILAVIKIVVGYFAGSISLVADGIHSISDMTTDIAVLLGVHFGSKQPDEEHQYGHGRTETFAAAFIGAALIVVGAVMIYRAAIDMAAGKYSTPGFVVLFVALISVVVKELLYRMTKRIAIKSHSSALYANAWHHRSDAFSSIAVVAGFISLKFGFKYGDQMAAVGVGLMIILVAIRIIRDCLSELTERAVDSDTIEHIKNIINDNSSIHQWHKLRTRTVGREVFLDLHILVAPDLSVADAHQIAENLEETLDEQINRPVNITVHIEPDIPDLRK
ncbi:MAG: cation diffusion facilitator family transporter [Planctomycetota bacterium]|jgi:cation diffusion facilitator family transporter